MAHRHLPSLLALAALGSAALAVACSSTSSGPSSSYALPPVANDELRDPSAFAVIADERARSQALFAEASRVIQHPRCTNCHPNGDAPLQGDIAERHDPPVLRGPDDHGVVGLECTSCHQDRNLELSRVPGAPKWALAPLSMAWTGKTTRQICEQIKDKARNGGKDLAAIVEHTKHDALVAWGWAPGSGRTPAPGDQARFGALMQAWADTGAECPPEGR